MLEEVLSALGLLDLLGPGQQRVEVAVLVDQLGGGLHADAGHARHVVGGIARQRLHLDDLVRADAKTLDHFVMADPPVLHRVEHADLVAHQLHQVLVGGNDGDLDAGLVGEAGIGGDDVVRLEARHLDGRQIEGPARVLDHGELRYQVFGRRRTVGLVVGIDLVAKRRAGRIEDDAEEVDVVVFDRLLDQLVQHVAEAADRPGRRPVRFAGQRGECVIGPEDIAGAVDQHEMARVGIGHPWIMSRLRAPPKPPMKTVRASAAKRIGPASPGTDNFSAQT